MGRGLVTRSSASLHLDAHLDAHLDLHLDPGRQPGVVGRRARRTVEAWPPST